MSKFMKISCQRKKFSILGLDFDRSIGEAATCTYMLQLSDLNNLFGNCRYLPNFVKISSQTKQFTIQGLNFHRLVLMAAIT